MKITIVAVGKIKEKYFVDAILEYSKRLSSYVQLTILELPDEKTPDKASQKEINGIKDKEGERILKAIPQNSLKISLAINGKQKTSEEFADFFSSEMVGGVSHFVFIIGGSLGLSDKVLQASNYLISFSRMTFPHQLMRVILLEQIYRAFKINDGSPYHK